MSVGHCQPRVIGPKLEFSGAVRTCTELWSPSLDYLPPWVSAVWLWATHLLQQNGRSYEAITDAQGRNPPACVTLATDSTALRLTLLIGENRANKMTPELYVPYLIRTR